MARVKRDEIYHVNQKSKTDSVGSIDEPISESFIKKLIQYDTEQFMLRVPFERAQYHQCIPNPYLEGELITVQIVTTQLREADVDNDNPESFQNQNLVDYEKEAPNMYQKYEFDANRITKIKSQIGDYFARELSAISDNIIQKTQYIKEKTERMVQKQDHAHLVSLTECKYQLKKRKKPIYSELQKILKPDQEVAIIGYWRKDKYDLAGSQSDFKCYHYFYVPNPLGKKQIARSTSTNHSLNQYLFKTLKHQNQEPSKVFFFYKKSPESRDCYLALLNCDPQINSMKKWNCEESKLTPSTLFNLLKEYRIKASKDIQGIFTQKTSKKQYQDPILLDDFEKPQDRRIAILAKPQFSKFSSNYQEEDKESFKTDSSANESSEQQSFMLESVLQQEVGPTLVMSEQNARGECNLVFYNVLKGEIVKRIIGGQAFVSYKKIDGKFGILTYLQQRPECDIDLSQMVTITLNNTVKQDGTEFNNKIDLDYGYAKETHFQSDKTKGLEVYLHNQGQFLTLVNLGVNSCTFQTKQDPKTLKKKMDLIYRLECENIQAMFYQGDLLVQTGIYRFKTLEHEFDNGFAVGELEFHNVSKSRLQSEEFDEIDIEDFLMPAEVTKVRISLSTVFLQAFESQGGQLFMFMPTTQQGNTKEIVGSVVCQEPSSSNFLISFFTQTLNQDEVNRDDYPQQPMRQTYMINYPILAYKCMTPDNRDIAIVHLAQKIPQRQIHLGKYQFVSFVHKDLDQKTTTKQIIIMVRDKNSNLKLLMIELDPWKCINRDSPFNEPETVFEFSENVSKEPDYFYFPKKYSPDKIRDVQILINSIHGKGSDKEQIYIATLVIQFEHCIATAAIGGSIFIVHCKPDQMIKEHQVRGQNDKVYFARKTANGSEICRLTFHKKFIKRIDTQTVYQTNNRVVAMQCDFGTVPLHKLRKHQSVEVQENLYVLDDQAILHCLDTSDEFKLVSFVDFKGHNFEKIIDDEWSHCHMSEKAITYNETIYQLCNGNRQKDREQLTFTWCKSKSKSSHFLVEPLFSTSNILAVGSETMDFSRQEFILMPSPTNRNQQILPFDQRQMIKHMIFVSNRNILVQFRESFTPFYKNGRQIRRKDFENVGKQSQFKQKVQEDQLDHQTVIFNASGLIVAQNKRVQEYLKGTIFGDSELSNGQRMITIHYATDEKNKLVCIRFNDQGYGRVDSVLENFQEILSYQVQQFIENSIKDIAPDIKAELENKRRQLEDEIEKMSQKQDNAQEDESYGPMRKDAFAIKQTDQPKIRKSFSMEPETMNKIAQKRTNTPLKTSQPKKDKKEEVILSYRKDTFKHAKMQFLNEIRDCLYYKRRKDYVMKHFHIVNKTQMVGDKEVFFMGVFNLPEARLLYKYRSHFKDFKPDEQPAQIHVHRLSVKDFTDKFQCKRSKIKAIKTVIIFQDRQCQDPEKNFQQFIHQLQWKIVGPYFCYRRELDKNIWITKHSQSDKKSSQTKKFLPLRQMIKEDLGDRLIDFHPISINSYLTIKSRGIGTNMRYYENLLQITNKNEAYVYDLDSEGEIPTEINQITEMEQLMTEGELINTGFILQILTIARQNHAILSRIFTNKQVSLYFLEVKSDQKFVQDRMRMMSLVGGRRKSQITNEEVFLSRKVKNQYTGSIHRTYSYLNLLELEKLEECLLKQEDLFISFDALLSTYEGHTIFSVLIDKADVFQHILNLFQDLELEDEENRAQKLIENTIFRRLYSILTMPVVDMVSDKSCPDYNCQTCIENNTRSKDETSKKCCGRRLKDSNEDDESCFCKDFASLCLKSVHYKSNKYRDIFLKLALKCRETSLITFVNSVDDLDFLLQTPNPAVHELFEQAFTTSKYCEEIETVDWRVDKSKIHVRSQHTIIGEDDLNKGMSFKGRKTQGCLPSTYSLFLRLYRWIQNVEKQKMLVDVKALHTGWIFRDTNSSDQNDLFMLINTLNTQPSDSLFSTEFVMVLVDEFWDLYQLAIFIIVFVPFIIYTIATILYFTLHAARQQESALEDQQVEQSWLEYVAKMLVISLTFYMFSFEVLQMMDRKWSYFDELANWVDQISSLLVLCLLIKNEWFIDTLYDLPYEHVLSTVIVGLTWYKVFYWMKLFNTTAFFINLLGKTFEDVNFKAFFIMIVILILAFSNIVYILNNARGSQYRYIEEAGQIKNEFLYPQSLDSSFSNSIIYLYKMTLGDFSTSGYDGNNQVVIWVTFFLATFLLQIVFLNMLIAIMGDTFSRVLDQKNQSSMRERIGILADFRLVVRALRLDAEFQYLFVITPNYSQIQDDEWDGELNEIKKTCQEFSDKLIQHQERSMKKQDEEIKTLKEQMNHMKETVGAIYGDVKGGNSDQILMRQEMKEMKELLGSVRSGVNYLKLEKRTNQAPIQAQVIKEVDEDLDLEDEAQQLAKQLTFMNKGKGANEAQVSKKPTKDAKSPVRRAKSSYTYAFKQMK